MEKRYESDMTRKDKMELEKKKLKSMTGKEKLAYIWEYYKLAIFGVIGFFVVIGIGLDLYENSKYETIVRMGVANSSFSENLEQAQQEILDLVGTGDKYEEVYIDTSFLLGEDFIHGDPQSVMRFQTISGTGDLDIFLCNEQTWKDLQKQETFADLSELIPKEEWEQYGISKGDTKMALPNNSAFLKKYKLVLYENCYGAIIINSKHKEEAVKTLKYLREEQ